MKHLDGCAHAAAAYTRLVACLPALEHIDLGLDRPLTDLGCLLEALAWCPRLKSLEIAMLDRTDDDGDVDDAAPHNFPALGCAPAFAKLRSLTKLALSFGSGEADPATYSTLVDALAPLSGLAELQYSSHGPALFPASLRQLKGLRSLKFWFLGPCIFEAGCLDLPLVQSLEFGSCAIPADMLSGITALQSLTSLEARLCQGPPLFARLPADLGSLRATLLHTDCSGQGLAHFPLALTQLVALKCLKATRNDFDRLPNAITNLARLTELRLGRVSGKDPLQLREKRPLDVRALGDLSAFPALCKLGFNCCEVVLCALMLGAVRHASLANLSCYIAYPAPECAPMVLHLWQTLRGLGRGSVLKFDRGGKSIEADDVLQEAQIPNAT